MSHRALYMTLIAAAVASLSRGQDLATWYWTVSDTGDGDGLVEPGEAARLWLRCGFDPPQPQEGGGFASSDWYDIRGDDAWAHGTVDLYSNLLWSGPGQGGHDVSTNWIVDIHNSQAPDAFNPAFDASNPIDLYFIQWTPDSYVGQSVTLDNGGPDIDVYTDPYGGGTRSYRGTGGVVSFRVAPSPGVLPIGAAAGLVLTRRRR